LIKVDHLPKVVDLITVSKTRLPLCLKDGNKKKDWRFQ